MLPIASLSRYFCIALLYSLHSVLSQDVASVGDCNSPNGGLYIPIHKPCTVTFYQLSGGVANTTRNLRGACDDVIRNAEDFVELSTEDAHVWPDMCLDDYPLRCYTVEEYRDLLALMGKDVLNFDDKDGGFAVVTSGTSHLMVNCTADAEDGIALPTEAMMAMSAGAIVAIVIAVLLCLFITVGILCCCCC